MTMLRSSTVAVGCVLLGASPALAAYGPYEAPVFFTMATVMLLGLAAPLLWWHGRVSLRRAVATIETLGRRLDAWPDGGIRLEADGGRVYGRLGAVLGDDDPEARPKALHELLAPLSDADREAVLSAVAAWDGGEVPRLTVETEEADRCYDILGVTGGDERILAFRDVTACHARVREAEARAARAEAEARRIGEIAEVVAIPLWRRDAEQRIQWCNREYARVVGVEAEEISRRSGVEIEPSIMAGDAIRLAQGALARGETAIAERHFVVGEQRRVFEITESIDHSGSGTIGCAVDVTDRHELRVDHRRFVEATSDVLNNLNSAIAIFGADRRLAFFNDAYARLWQLDVEWLSAAPSHAELLDAILERRLLPEQADFPAYKERVMALYTNLLGTSEEFDYLPDGRTLRSLTAPYPLGGLLLVHEDVTDRLRLERSYNTLIAVQRETLDNLHESVAVFGSDSRLKLYNPQFSEMWRLTERNLDGEPHVSEIIEAAIEAFGRPSEWIEQMPLVANLIAEQRAVSRRMERPDGSVIDFSTMPLPDGNLLVTYLDVTDGVRIERALRERNEALQTADRLKTEFIANMSYELRSPLNVILGFVEILDQEYFGQLNEKQKEYCAGIIDSSHRLLALVNDILDLASVEAGQLELDLSTFDVATLLAGVIDLTREHARSRGIVLELECLPELGEITGDARRLRQVMMNLLSNAFQYSHQGSRVVVLAGRAEDGVAITVVDEGIGIEAEHQNRVFERFDRGGRTRSGYGAGLGLALVKSFVELHGGVVALESDVDIGTKVTVSLPSVPRTETPEDEVRLEA